MARTDLYGSRGNKKQGTQEPAKGKSRPAAAYGRSESRAPPTGNTTFTNSWQEDRAARNKRMGTGPNSKQKLFP